MLYKVQIRGRVNEYIDKPYYIRQVLELPFSVYALLD